MPKKAKKKARGRPPKKSGKMDIRLHLVIDKQRNQRYRAAAEQAGVDLSEWIRRVCDAAADQELDGDNPR